MTIDVFTYGGSDIMSTLGNLTVYYIFRIGNSTRHGRDMKCGGVLSMSSVIEAQRLFLPEWLHEAPNYRTVSASICRKCLAGRAPRNRTTPPRLSSRLFGLMRLRLYSGWSYFCPVISPSTPVRPKLLVIAAEHLAHWLSSRWPPTGAANDQD